MLHQSTNKTELSRCERSTPISDFKSLCSAIQQVGGVHCSVTHKGYAVIELPDGVRTFVVMMVGEKQVSMINVNALIDEGKIDDPDIINMNARLERSSAHRFILCRPVSDENGMNCIELIEYKSRESETPVALHVFPASGAPSTQIAQ